MKLKFADNKELDILGVHGRSVEYQGVRRDCLTFLIDPTAIGLEDACNAFTPEQCKRITLEDAEGQYVHENYTVRIDAGQGRKDFTLTGVANEQGQSEVVYIRMAQSTLAEREIMVQGEILENLLVKNLEG